jgi:nucleoside-diphosphate-sugar epimerase
MTTAEGQSRTALVTGATGFIGRHLVRRLSSDGWTVQALVRATTSLRLTPPIGAHQVPRGTDDLVGLVRELAPSVCFHLATDFRARHAADDVDAMLEANVAFGTRLAEALTQADHCPLVNAGTAWQHFEGRDYGPTSLYAATKQALEDVLRFYTEVEGLPVATLKFFDTYGPGDPRPKLVPLLMAALHREETVELSSGEQLVDLLHVDDAVEALLAVASFLAGGDGSPAQFSAHSDSPVTVRRLVQILGDVTGHTLRVRWNARADRPREMLTPWRFAPRPPGWTPRVALEEGLRSVAKVRREA